MNPAGRCGQEACQLGRGWRVDTAKPTASVCMAALQSGVTKLSLFSQEGP